MWKFLRSISLTKWIMVSMVVGIFVGWLWPDTAVKLSPLSTIFLRLIKSIIVPLVFSMLVVGIAGHGDDMKRVGRLALKSIIYFEVVTTAALFIGLGAVHLTKPGLGVHIPTAQSNDAAALAANKPTLTGLIEHSIPQSIFEAASKNEVLQIVVFALLFAAALSQVRGKPREAMFAFFEGLSEVMFKYTALVMYYAPIGIGAAIAVTVGRSGIGVLLGLGKLVLTLYGALIFFVLAVLLPVALIARVPIRRFITAVKTPWLIAFSTASSEAALPQAMQAMEAIGVPRRIVAFVMPTGYSFNLDGSTLYLAIAAVFVAQAAGVPLTFGQELLMMLTLMLTTKGVAAVPRAALVILSGTLTSFGLPLEGVAVILGVDAFMDMARTSINLVGNCLATVVMARWENDFHPERPVPMELRKTAEELGIPTTSNVG